jgi:hypothetical protein
MPDDGREQGLQHSGAASNLVAPTQQPLPGEGTSDQNEIRLMKERGTPANDESMLPSKSDVLIAKWTRVVAIWTRGLVGVGLLTAVALFFQFWSFVRSERAFVFPSSVSFAEPLAVADIQPILLTVELTNYGRSLAIIDKLTAFVSHPLPTRPNYTGKGGVEIAYPPIPANGKIGGQLNFDTWGKQTMEDVSDGVMPFHIFGQIEYEDEYSAIQGIPLFGRRISDFCFVYVANKVDASKAVFRNCPEPEYTRVRD